MSDRHSFTRSQRIDVLHAASGICHWCGLTINSARESFEVEHVIPLALGGSNETANLRPIHQGCHREKTRGDVKKIAKAKRVKAKHNGTFRPPRHIVPGSKAHTFKKKLNGEVVRRDTGETVRGAWRK